MNETPSTQAINKKVRANGVYALKIQTLMNNGVPDCYYSGNKADLWCEMKYIADNKLPKKEDTAIQSMLSSLQEDWLNNRFKEGRNVVVVIGSKLGYLIQQNPLVWNSPILKEQLKLSRNEIVNWIINYCHHES